MKLTELAPMLWVDDVRATIDYYVSVLGFEEANYQPDWLWGLVEKDAVRIMLAGQNEHIPYNGPQFTGSLYLRTDDVEAWWNNLKDKADVYYAIENFEYGMREFAIRDCNGYIIQFGQDISAH